MHSMAANQGAVPAPTAKSAFVFASILALPGGADFPFCDELIDTELSHEGCVAGMAAEPSEDFISLYD